MTSDEPKDRVIIHGGVFQGGHRGVGQIVALTDKEAKQIDPDGNCLMLKTRYDANMGGEKAKAAAIAKIEKDQAAGELRARAEKEKAEELSRLEAEKEEKKHGHK